MAGELFRYPTLYNDSRVRAYYRFNAGALLKDSTANGYDLTNGNSVAEGFGIWGGVADFSNSNTNKYLRVASNLGVTNSVSVVLRVKLLTEVASGSYTFCQFYNANNGRHIRIYYDYNSGTRRIRFVSDRADIAGVECTYNITLGTSGIYTVILTFDNSTGATIGYLDGSSVANVTVSGNGSTAYSSVLTLGAVYNIANSAIENPASCLIDDTWVLNGVLTPTEITNFQSFTAPNWKNMLTNQSIHRSNYY